MTRINAGYRRFLFLMALNQVTPGRYPNTKAGTVACPERSEKCEAGKPGCHKATIWDGLYQAFAVILDGLFLGLPHDFQNMLFASVLRLSLRIHRRSP